MANLRLSVKNASYAPGEFVRVITSVKDPVCEDEEVAIRRQGNVIFTDFNGRYESLRDAAQRNFGKERVTLTAAPIIDSSGTPRQEVIIDLGPRP